LARYVIVPERSTVWIDARSSLHPIHSEVRGMTGFVDVEVTDTGTLDLKSTPGGQLELAVDLMSSGNPLYDREMKRRIEARKFPTITGKLRAIDGNGSSPYRVSGDVTFMGVTKHYEEAMTIAAKEDMLVLEGEHTFDIRDFGMDPPKILMLKVHPEVDVRVEIAAKREA
jgi:polyisoprenoid-binding protein YceI